MKTRKAFLYGFLMLAFVTLLSGMTQAKTMVDETTFNVVSVHSPPAMLPINVFVFNAISSEPAVTWYSTLNPGYHFNASVTISDGILYTDMLDMQCYSYYIVDKPDLSLPTLPGYVRPIDKYPFELQNNVQIGLLAYYQINKSVTSWIYRQPRDGLRKS